MGERVKSLVDGSTRTLTGQGFEFPVSGWKGAGFSNSLRVRSTQFTNQFRVPGFGN